MSEAPERIWAWRFNPTWQGGYWREDKNAVQPEQSGAEYVRADTIDAGAALLQEAKIVIGALCLHYGEWPPYAREWLAKLEARK